MNKPQEGVVETCGAVIALIVVFFAYLVLRRPRPGSDRSAAPMFFIRKTCNAR
jgi:hypothetical protein